MINKTNQQIKTKRGEAMQCKTITSNSNSTNSTNKKKKNKVGDDESKNNSKYSMIDGGRNGKNSRKMEQIQYLYLPL